MWRILVVDDNFINRKLLLEILRDKANCDIAAGGQEAIEAYDLSLQEDNPYDAILLDISMPEVSGLDVLRDIRGKEAGRGIELGRGVPIIMVTAFKEPFMESFNLGCDDYLLKPVDVAKLLEKLEAKIKA